VKTINIYASELGITEEIFKASIETYRAEIEMIKKEAIKLGNKFIQVKIPTPEYPGIDKIVSGEVDYLWKEKTEKEEKKEADKAAFEERRKAAEGVLSKDYGIFRHLEYPVYYDFLDALYWKEMGKEQPWLDLVAKVTTIKEKYPKPKQK